MNPIQLQPGYYWRTNDAADLAFSEAGPERPTHINCYNLHDTLNRGETARVPVAGLQLMTKAYFGERKVGWTGDAYKFGIYRLTSEFGRGEIVIIVSHGGGMEAFSLSDLVAVQTWTHLAAHLSEELLWNLCYEIMHAHRAVKSEATRRMSLLFLENRLKKRKRRNRLSVEILPSTKV
jgi:hypothetical protein